MRRIRVTWWSACVLWGWFAMDASAQAVHPSDDIVAMTDLPDGVSRALARAIRTTMHAIPVIADARVSVRTGERIDLLVAYQVAANEVCVRTHMDEGGEALRAARAACRGVRGVLSFATVVRCVPAPGGRDACATSEMLFVVELGVRERRMGSARVGQELSGIRVREVSVGDGVAPMFLVDYVRAEWFVDPRDARGGGELPSLSHEAVLIEGNGAVALRADLTPLWRSEIHEGASDEVTVRVRVRSDGAQFALDRCEDASRECPLTWSAAFPRAHEPPVAPRVPSVESVPATDG